MAEANRMDQGSDFSQQAKTGGGEQNLGQQVGTGMSAAPSMPPSSSARQSREAARRLVGEESRGGAEQRLEDASAKLSTFQQRAEQYVRENPVTAVVTAVALGFVLALISRR